MQVVDMFTDFCGVEDLNKTFNIEEINSEILKYKANIDPKGIEMSKSNRGGYQSDDLNFDEIIKNYPLLKRLFDYSIGRVKELLEHQGVFIGNAWININESGDYNAKHTHAGSIISGIVYISVPEDMDGGELRFHRERSFEDYGIYKFLKKNIYGSGSYTIKPYSGLFVLFPSNIEHSVEQHFSSKNRITLAINFPCMPI